MVHTRLAELTFHVQEIGLCFVRKWWRPLGCMALVAATVVNTVILPIHKGESVDLPGLALVITAFAPIVAIRAWELQKNPDK